MKIGSIVRLKHRLAGFAVVLAAMAGLAQAADMMTVYRVYIVAVPPAQDHAFNQGVKAWNKCQHAHGVKQPTLVYDAETGDLTRYLFLNPYKSWAAMDVHDPAGKACNALFETGVLPHVGSAFSEVSELNAKATYMPDEASSDPAPMMWVDAYQIKSGQGPAFNEAVAQFAAAAAKTHWMGHFAGYDINGGGQGAANFVLVWPNKNWADIGQDPSPSAKDMMASVYGAAAAESEHQKFLAAIDAHWEDSWGYDKDLSVIPGK